MLLAGGLLVRRCMRPTLSPEAQVKAVITGIARGFEKRKSGQVKERLSEGFVWQGRSRDDLASELRGAFFVIRDVKVTIEQLTVTMAGDSAEVRGGYHARWRRSADAPFESQGGDLVATVRKEAGKWKLVSVEGVAPPPL